MTLVPFNYDMWLLAGKPRLGHGEDAPGSWDTLFEDTTETPVSLEKGPGNTVILSCPQWAGAIVTYTEDGELISIQGSSNDEALMRIWKKSKLWFKIP